MAPGLALGWNGEVRLEWEGRWDWAREWEWRQRGQTGWGKEERGWEERWVRRV
jgi:hypothetical protein